MERVWALISDFFRDFLKSIKKLIFEKETLRKPTFFSSFFENVNGK